MTWSVLGWVLALGLALVALGRVVFWLRRLSAQVAMLTLRVADLVDVVEALGLGRRG